MKIFVFFISIVQLALISKAQITFQKVYGGQPYEAGYSIQQTADSGYIVAGRTIAFGSPGFDAYLIKTDVYGDILWTKTYGGANTDEAYSVEQTTDSGYIIAGYTKSYGAGYEDVYLIKTNANGDLLWSKAYGGVEYDEGHFVQQTKDGGYIVTGYTISYGAGYMDVYLIKTDSLGNKLWAEAYGKPDTDEGLSVEQTSDAGYIIAGYTNYSFLGNNDAYLIKTDSLGNLQWSKAFGGNDNESFYFVHQTPDGGYILTGASESVNVNNQDDVCLIKTDSIGNILWSRTFGSTDVQVGFSVQQTIDGGYIISGADQGSAKVYLIKTNANGKTGCNEAYDTTITSTPATQEASIGSFVSSPFTVIQAPPTIVGSGGIMGEICISFGLNEITENRPFFILPNPAKDYFTISFAEIINMGTIEIFNILGENIYAENIFNKSKKEITLKNVYPGIYFVKVYVYPDSIGNGEKQFCKKIIIE